MCAQESRTVHFFSQPRSSGSRPDAAEGEDSEKDLPAGKNEEDGKSDANNNNDDEDEDLPVPTAEIEEEPDPLDGLRASFPIAFGKQEAKIAPLENVHAQTKRGVQKSKVGGKKGKAGIAIKIGGSLEKRIQQGLDVNNSSSKAEVSNAEVDNKRGDSRREGPEEPSAARGFVAPPHPASASSAGVREDQENGSTRVKTEAGEGFVGPPQPPPTQAPGDMADEDGQETLLIGPPRPGGQVRKAEKATGSKGRKEARAEEESDDESDDESEEEEEGDEFGVPLSNEIVLGGHTKVRWVGA